MQIKHLTLQTHELEPLYHFYQETLGLPISISDAAGTALTVQMGASRLSFQLSPGFEGAYHIAINIPENQFPDAVNWLMARTDPIRDSSGKLIFHFETWNAHSIYFYDPAGNVLELIARHDLSTASDAPFNSSSLLAISEVGLTADHAPTLASILRSELAGLTVFHDSENELFSALGSDEGLFIVVNAGREWYPETGKFARMNPISILIEQSGKQFQLSAHPITIQLIS